MTSRCELPQVAVTTGSITGVIYCDGQPIQGVNVEISPGGNSYISKADGSYSFLDLSAGQYTLQFTKKGYKPLSKTLTVIVGSDVRGDVMIEIDPNILKISPEVLEFSNSFNNLPISLSNVGSSSVQWAASLKDDPIWASLSTNSGTLTSNGKTEIVVSVDRSKVIGEKASTVLTISSSLGQVLSVNINVTAGKAASARVALGNYDSNSFSFNVIVSENTSGFYVACTDFENMTADEVVRNGLYEKVKSGVYEYSYDATGRDPNTKYYIYVVPINEYGQQGEMLKAYFTTPDEEDKKPTANVTFSNVTSTSFDVRLSFSEDTQNFYFLASLNGTYTEGDILNSSNTGPYKCEGDEYLEYTAEDGIEPNTSYYFYVIPVSKSGTKGDFVKKSVTTSKTGVSLNDYLGYWDLTGKDYYYDEDVYFERIYIEPYTQRSENAVIVNGLLYGEDHDFFSAVGEYNAQRKAIDLLGGIYFPSRTYHYNSDPDVNYYSIFYPAYCDGESAWFVSSPEGEDHPITTLTLKNNKISVGGGPKADNKGRYANGYSFVEYYASDDTRKGNLLVIYDATMTRSSNQNIPSSAKILNSRNKAVPTYIRKAESVKKQESGVVLNKPFDKTNRQNIKNTNKSR